MNFTGGVISQQQKVKIKNLLPEIGISQMREEIIQGLTAEPKSISSKYFYDKTGSELFNQITQLPEYYPTRTEKSILHQIAPELMNRNSSFEIIELGSGDCSKISILLDAIDEQRLENIYYVPVDVSKSAIENSARELCERYSDLQINGYVADFMHQLNLIPRKTQKRIICFFGSTIGNFSAADAELIIKNLADELEGDDSLLIGFDLVKPRHLLHAAYNDAAGITHAFNKNILNVVNQIIESDFHPDDFDSHSFFNEDKLRNEMHLVANKNCTVCSPFLKEQLRLKMGDSFHTESSHKYSVSAIKKLTEPADLIIQNIFTDSNQWFALVEFSKA